VQHHAVCLRKHGFLVIVYYHYQQNDDDDDDDDDENICNRLLIETLCKQQNYSYMDNIIYT